MVELGGQSMIRVSRAGRKKCGGKLTKNFGAAKAAPSQAANHGFLDPVTDAVPDHRDDHRVGVAPPSRTLRITGTKS